jgi:hypothetical protein
MASLDWIASIISQLPIISNTGAIGESPFYGPLSLSYREDKLEG